MSSYLSRMDEAPSLERAVSVLARELGIDPLFASQFRARCVSMRRVGLHPEMKRGKGTASRITPEQALEMSLAAQLNLCGFFRERAIEVVQTNRERIRKTAMNPFVLTANAVMCGRHIEVDVWVPAAILDAAIEARRRDSDESPEGGDGEAGSVRSTTARAGTASPADAQPLDISEQPQ